ncbi:MAG: hypothetical protein CVU18_03915 [Betaproteobacteria bacterium HGW-Betaproteobacteria-12]|nr:MAG: hypothetical protein CVU18_03915 [Betaproteobacteria bacterium HGW-Betaproteobacteria-12]
MKALLLLAVLASGPALAYTGDELRGDCQAADAQYRNELRDDPATTVRATRCLAYVAGFADGYAVSRHLADKVGVGLNAFCLPQDDNLPARLVRAVLAHFERLPPNSDSGTATLVAGALSRAFPCPD